MSGVEQARQALLALRARVDAHFDQARLRSPGAFACAEGCHACCAPNLSVFELEAAPIRDALARLDPATRNLVRRQGSDPGRDRCPLLVEGRCSVYARRPLICRSHGLPVADEDGSVSWCPLNFTDDSVPGPSVLRLPVLNAPLGVAAQMFDGAGARVELAALARGE